MDIQLYRIEYPDGLGPHSSKYYDRICDEFFIHAISCLRSPDKDFILKEFFVSGQHYFAFTSQDALFMYIGKFINNLLVDNPGFVVEITVDDKEIIVDTSGFQAMFELESVKNKIVVLKG